MGQGKDRWDKVRDGELNDLADALGSVFRESPRNPDGSIPTPRGTGGLGLLGLVNSLSVDCGNPDWDPYEKRTVGPTVAFCEKVYAVGEPEIDLSIVEKLLETVPEHPEDAR